MVLVVLLWLCEICLVFNIYIRLFKDVFMLLLKIIPVLQ